jgi:hypothetical protein
MCGVMDDLNLGSNESVIKEIGRIIIDGFRYDAVFTSRRLIIRNDETRGIYLDLLYPDIVLAVQGLNTLQELTITLTYTSDGEQTKTAELSFVRLFGDKDVRACDDCLTILKDYQVPVEITDSTKTRFGGRGSSGRRDVPEMSAFGAQYSSRQAPEEEEEEPSIPHMIAVILISIMIIFTALVIIGDTVTERNIRVAEARMGAVPTATPASDPTTVTAIPTVTTTTVIPESPVPTPTIEIVPQNGVYVRIEYPGNYTGSINGNGFAREVNSSGIQVYQVFLSSGTIGGSIEKGDGSADTMGVQIYKNGGLVSSMNTSRPFGVLEIHQTV